MTETILEAGWVPEHILAAYLLASHWTAPTKDGPHWVSPEGILFDNLPDAVLHQIESDYV